MKRRIKWPLLLTIVVIIGLSLILFNPLLIKSPIERLLSSSSGYEVSLNGDLRLSIGREISVQATDILISNSDYKAQPKLAEVGSIDVSIKTASLMSDAIVIPQLTLNKTLIDLDSNKSGDGNWKKASRVQDKNKTAEPRKSFNIKNIQISNSNLRYQQHKADKNHLLNVTSFVQAEGHNGLLNITLDASFNDRPATFTGHVGTFADIIKGRNISFDGKGQLGPLKISGKGLIDDLIHPKQPEFDIRVVGPDIKEVTAMLNIDDLGSGPFDLQAHGRETNGKYAAAIEGTIGNVTLKVNAQSRQAGNFDNLAVTLNAKGPNLGAVARAFGKSGWPDQSFSINGDIQRNGSKLVVSPLKIDIGGANFLLNAKLTNFPRFDPSEVSLSIKGDDVAHFRELLGIKGNATGAFSMQGDFGISDKNVRQLTFSAKTPLGEAKVSGSLGPPPAYSDTKLHVNLRGHNAYQFMSLFGLEMLPEAPFTLDSDFQLGFVGTSEVQRVTLDNLNIELADTELGGNVAFDAQEPLKSGSGSLRLSSKDIANLKRFPVLQKTAELFVPGQPFNISGNLLLADQTWHLNGLKGGISKASLSVDGVLEPSHQWAGSSIDFNVGGPGLHLLLNNIGPSSHLQEAFTSSGTLQITNNRLELSGFKFTSDNANATLKGSLAWPVVHGGEIEFELDTHGEDISRFVPEIGKFKPHSVAFTLKAAGTQQQNRTVFKTLTASAGNLKLNLSGSLHNDIKKDGNANFSLTSTNISKLGRFDNRPLPDADLTMTADVHGSLKHFELEQMKVQLGTSDLNGSLEVLLGGLKPGFVLHSRSDMLDIRLLQPQHPPAAIAKPVKDKENRMIPATPLPLDSLRKFDAQLDVSIKQLKLKADNLKNVQFKATIKDGALDMPVLTLEGQRGSISSALNMTTTGPDQADVTIEVRTNGFVLDVGKHASFDANTIPKLDLYLKAKGQGGNLRDIAGTANGILKAGSQGGTLAGVNLGLLDSYFLDEIFSLILPKSKQHDNTQLTCAAVVFKLENGVAETNPALAFTTNKITLVSKGTLDLSTEKLNFDFKATPNNLLKVSASELLNSFILVGGTLSKPEVGLDPSKVLLQGGAAVGTAGISLLARGLFDRVGNTLPVCQSMLADMQN